MADCTKTVDFLREWERMCHKCDCTECPISNAKPLLIACNAYIMHKHDDAIAIVQKWSDEHPVMTWAGKLKELLPNVDMNAIVGACCPYSLHGGDAPHMSTPLTRNCRGTFDECARCWNGEYKEG